MINFENLGYKDITKDKPIHFKELIGEFFEINFPYNKRFYKQEGIITIELVFGNLHNLCSISGICYYSKGWEKFVTCGDKDNITEMFIQTLNAVKLKIKENINN